jgi:spoIIIJ-associated protein
MQCELEAKAYTGEDFIYIEMTGRDSRTIIGKRGSTLNSIQYIANIVYNKQKDDYERVILDVEGYRVKREKSLEVIAQRMSTKVVRSGRPVKLEPMNPYERKIIHAALQYSTQVFTKSEGEEPFRRVVILRKR